jgi:hypothetical protein
MVQQLELDDINWEAVLGQNIAVRQELDQIAILEGLDQSANVIDALSLLEALATEFFELIHI